MGKFHSLIRTELLQLWRRQQIFHYKASFLISQVACTCVNLASSGCHGFLRSKLHQSQWFWGQNFHQSWYFLASGPNAQYLCYASDWERPLINPSSKVRRLLHILQRFQSKQTYLLSMNIQAQCRPGPGWQGLMAFEWFHWSQSQDLIWCSYEILSDDKFWFLALRTGQRRFGFPETVAWWAWWRLNYWGFRFLGISKLWRSCPRRGAWSCGTCCWGLCTSMTVSMMLGCRPKIGFGVNV